MEKKTKITGQVVSTRILFCCTISSSFAAPREHENCLVVSSRHNLIVDWLKLSSSWLAMELKQLWWSICLTVEPVDAFNEND